MAHPPLRFVPRPAKKQKLPPYSTALASPPMLPPNWMRITDLLQRLALERPYRAAVFLASLEKLLAEWLDTWHCLSLTADRCRRILAA